jgi:hypothetical protein
MIEIHQKPLSFINGEEEELLTIKQDIDLSNIMPRKQTPSDAVICSLIIQDITSAHDAEFI